MIMSIFISRLVYIERERGCKKSRLKTFVIKKRKRERERAREREKESKKT